MMYRRRQSNNYKVLRTISSKMRQLDSSMDSQYFILYSFLYKYCSDTLKEHFKSVCDDKSVTLAQAYRDESLKGDLRDDALNMYGFHITSPNSFIDAIIEEYYSDQFFLHAFYMAFKENIEFDEDSKYGQYFNFIFEQVGHAVNFKKYEFVDPNHLIVKEIIFSISKLDVFEKEFPFVKVFEKICQSKLVKVDHDPDYLNLLMSSVVSSNINSPENVYMPFLNDASLLTNLYSDCGVSWSKTYAKSHDSLSYCCSLIKLLIYNFDLDTVYSEFKSPFEPFEDFPVKFDVIMSILPPITSQHLKKFNLSNTYEIAKRNSRKQVKSLLSDQLNIDKESFDSDAELNMLVENLIDKMDLSSDIDTQLVGEYESLKYSEYLFLLNMINSLKDDGIMVLAMSQSFLVKNSLESLRKYLTFEKNYIDAIISIPDELSRPSRLEIIVVFKKNRMTDEIVFIDMSQDFETRKAPYSVPGMFIRNLTFDKNTVSKVLDVYNNRKVIEKFSDVVKISDIKKNDFNLSISRYVDSFEGEFIRLDDLKSQKDEINENIEKLNKKIDLMMGELGIK